MKMNLLLIIFFTIVSLNVCGFITSEYIKDFSSVREFDLELKNSDLKTGMMLIYSTYCGHCHNFLKTYESLAKMYNKKLLFYAMNVYSDYHKIMPRTNGVPYILFFSDGYFYPFKGKRSFEYISSILEKNYLPRCKHITYKNIENVYYNIFMKNETYKNLIISFFDENSENEIKNFRKENDLLFEEFIGLCYVCNDFKEIKDKNTRVFKYIENNMIVGYLRNNISKIFLWDNNDYKNNYEKFIKEELKLEYINLDDKNKKYLINFLRNKTNLIFSYRENEEKTIYQNYINGISNRIKFNMNLVLYNFPNFIDNILSFINESGLYEINGELNFIEKFNNFYELENKIFKNFNKTDLNNTNKNNELLIQEVKKENKTEEEDEEDSFNFFDFDLFFEVLEKICVVLFTVVLTMAIFFLNYNIYYKKIDQQFYNNHSINK